MGLVSRSLNSEKSSSEEIILLMLYNQHQGKKSALFPAFYQRWFSNCIRRQQNRNASSFNLHPFPSMVHFSKPSFSLLLLLSMLFSTVYPICTAEYLDKSYRIPIKIVPPVSRLLLLSACTENGLL